MLLKMNITVYLGASSGNDDKFQIAVRELGNWIGENGHTLVYGGSKAGLMGDLAESVLLSGGKVIGVEPQFFIDAGFEYNDITELIVTHDMSERKAKMIELGNAFITFPGGSGTLEEISEVISKVIDNYNFNDTSAIAKKEYEKLYTRLSRKYSGTELEYKIKEKLYQKGLSYEKDY